jgi:hypothetical protein
MIEIEHWREGELFEVIKITKDMVRRHTDGSVSVKFPPGLIEIATDDELRFAACQLKAIARKQNDSTNGIPTTA